MGPEFLSNQVDSRSAARVSSRASFNGVAGGPLASRDSAAFNSANAEEIEGGGSGAGAGSTMPAALVGAFG
jgi:hypothetical protein